MNTNDFEVRYASIEYLMHYIGLGRNRALDVGRESGARIKVGKRTLYDLRKVDEYLSKLRDEQEEGK